ncbi:hypothetical protein NQ318_017910, partial [Aromia moschata]
VALRDSPAGLAAYIIEKFITLTDPDGIDMELDDIKKFGFTKLLDNVVYYWITNSITTSMRIYHETFKRKHLQRFMDIASKPINVPSSCPRCLNDLQYPPERILRKKFKNLFPIKNFTCGHFAAFEEPVEMAKDIYEFVTAVEYREDK